MRMVWRNKMTGRVDYLFIGMITKDLLLFIDELRRVTNESL